MKKFLAIAGILLILASSSYAAARGKWGISINNIATTNFASDMTAANLAFVASVPCIEYNYTDDDSVSAGYYSVASKASIITKTFMKLCHYFGHENLSPQIGISYAVAKSDDPARAFEYSDMSLLFGTAVNLYEGLSLEFDFRPLSSATRQTVRTDDPSDRRDDYTNATFVNILPMFNLKWVF